MMGAQGLCSCLEKIQKKKWNNSLWTQTSQDSLAKSEEQPDCDRFSYKCFITIIWQMAHRHGSVRPWHSIHFQVFPTHGRAPGTDEIAQGKRR